MYCDDFPLFLMIFVDASTEMTGLLFFLFLSFCFLCQGHHWRLVFLLYIFV